MSGARRRAPLGADLRILFAGLFGFLLQCLKTLRPGAGIRGTRAP